MYTVPAKATYTEPWITVLASHSFDVVQILTYDSYSLFYNLGEDLTDLVAFGVLANQIVIGVMPGCHNAPFEFTSIQDVVSSASEVRRRGLNGLAMWSVNRDALVRPYLDSIRNPRIAYTTQGSLMALLRNRSQQG
jgi:hypothetical protein